MPKIASPWRRGRIAGVLSLFVLVGLGIPASAQATWSAPITLSPTGHSAWGQQVGIDQGGDAVFVWYRPDGTDDCGGNPPGCTRVQAVARSVAGTLSSVQTVSPAGQYAEAPQVGVDPNGNAVITWLGHVNQSTCVDCSVQARARSAAGTLGSTQVVSPPDSVYGYPQVGVDQGGNAVFGWHGSSTTQCGGYKCSVLARALSAAGALSATQELAGPSDFQPDLAVEQDGDAVFVWQHRYFDGTTSCSDPNLGVPPGCLRIQIRARSASGALGPTQTLSANGQDALYAHVGVDASGNAVAVWQRPDTSGATRIQARARAANGTLSATQTLSPAGESASEPQVAVAPSGDAVVVWTSSDSRVKIRSRAADGTLSRIQSLSAAGSFALYPQVALDQDGNAVVVWKRQDGTTDCGGAGCFRIQARTRAADGTLGVTQTLSARGGHADFSQIAVNANGNAAAVWQRDGGLFRRIQAAVGP